MPKISKRFVIAAPAAAVWEVIGPGYARIGEWATAIPASAETPHTLARNTVPALAAAPVAGRVCATGLAIIPEVTENLVAYDDERRSLTYEAAGLPSYVALARNTWTVTALDDERCVVTVEAQFDTRGILGAFALWLLLAQVGRTSQHLGEDLRHFVQHDTPSPRKLRQLRADARRTR